jgi:hypothetical protein
MRPSGPLDTHLGGIQGSSSKVILNVDPLNFAVHPGGTGNRTCWLVSDSQVLAPQVSTKAMRRRKILALPRHHQLQLSSPPQLHDSFTALGICMDTCIDPLLAHPREGVVPPPNPDLHVPQHPSAQTSLTRFRDRPTALLFSLRGQLGCGIGAACLRSRADLTVFFFGCLATYFVTPSNYTSAPARRSRRLKLSLSLADGPCALLQGLLRAVSHAKGRCRIVQNPTSSGFSPRSLPACVAPRLAPF